jgi:hypothetical protein
MMDDCYETEQCLVNECRSHVAWHRRNDCYDDVDHRCDFASGFRDGYRATAERGDHCLPMMPPRKFWKHCYQDCEGRQEIDAWYEGYAHGMLAANQDGVYDSQQLPFYGLQQYGGIPNATHSAALEENDRIEPVPEPTPLKELPVDETYGEPVSAPPVTGHSIPAPAPPRSEPENLPDSEQVISPRFLPQYPDGSSSRHAEPLARPDLPLP